MRHELTTIKLYGHLGRKFGRVHRLAVNSPGEAIRFLSATRPGFREYLFEHRNSEISILTGHTDRGKDEINLPTSARVIRFIPVVEGANSPWVRIGIGAVLIVAGVLITPYAPMVGPYLISTGASLIMGGVAQLIAGSPAIRAETQNENAPNYVFSGAVNTTRQGYPVPLVYGRLRVGSAVISSSLATEDYFVGTGAGSGFRFITPVRITVNSTGGSTAVSTGIEVADGSGDYTFSLVDGSGQFTIDATYGILTSITTVTDDTYRMDVDCLDNVSGATISSGFIIQVADSGLLEISSAPPVIRGAGGGGGGSQHVPNESPDSLHSKATARILDLISEGPIHGLVGATTDEQLASIYLNDTPIMNADGTLNFQDVVVDTRLGAQDQGSIEGFPTVEDSATDGRKITYGAGFKTITVSDTSRDAIRVLLGFPSLTKTETNGDMNGTSVQVKISLSCNGGAYTEILQDTITGKTTSRYQRGYRIPLRSQGAGPWIIKVERLTADSVSLNLTNDSYLDAYTLITEEKLTYPNSALVGIKCDAKNFSSLPSRAYLVDGIIIRVPSNYDPATRAYTGNWDGSFKPAPTVCSNPAWVLFDLLTSKRYGLGDWISEDQIDKGSLYQIAQYCDQMISDGKGGTEPRFSANLYLQTREDCFRVIQNICSIFRGLPYWSSGALYASQDRPRDSVYLYTASNVVDGKFTYSGTARKARHNVALITYVDPSDSYRSKVEYVADQDAILELGSVSELQIGAFGCSSQGQAHRLGRWALYTERWENEVVSFRTGFEGIMARPGDVIRIQDPDRSSRRFGGRIISSDGINHVLDGPVDLSSGSWTFWTLLQDGSVVSRAVRSNGTGATIQTEQIADPPGHMAQWLISDINSETEAYQVLGITENSSDEFEITALKHYPAKFDLVESALSLDNPPSGSNPGGGSRNITPTGLTIASYSAVQTDRVAVIVRADWIQVAQATEYRVEWRRDSDNWTALAPQVTSACEIQDAIPGTYSFRVCAVVGGVVSPWVAETAVVAGDTRDDYLTNAEKTAILTEWNRVTAEKSDLDAQADLAGTSRVAYDAAYVILYSYLNDLPGYVYTPSGTPYPVSGWSNPAGSMILLGPGGGLNWAARWQAYYDAATVLSTTIAGTSATAISAIFADDKVSPNEKQLLERWWQDAYNERYTATTGLDAQADQATVSRTAYDNAYDAVHTWFTSQAGWNDGTRLWTDRTSTITLSVGGGLAAATLWRTLYSTRDALWGAIQNATTSPDWLPLSRKKQVKSDYDLLTGEQVNLDTAADQVNVSHATYDGTVTALIAYMDGLTPWNPATHDWDDYVTAANLGTGGGTTLLNTFRAVETARTNLQAAIDGANAAAPFKSVQRWEMAPSSDGGATVTLATTADSPSPDHLVARRYTATAGPGSRLTMSVNNRPGAQMPTVKARVRLVSGSWSGVLQWSLSGGHGYSGSYQATVTQAPVTGVWVTVSWDLRSTADWTGGTISGLQLDLASTNGAVIDVDWISAGTSGTGSLADQDDAISRAIWGLLAQGNVSVFQNVVIANLTNLFPNGDSEIPPASMPADSWGLVALQHPATYAYAGTGARRVVGIGTGSSRVQVTPRIAVLPGEYYALTVQCRAQAATGKARVLVEQFDISGGSLGMLLDKESTLLNTWESLGGAAAVSATCYSICVHLEAKDLTAASYAYFDAAMLRKAMDSNLIVDGVMAGRKVVGDIMQTSDYTEDGFGVPTAGAKMDASGTAIKCADAGLQVGGLVFNQASNRINRFRNAGFRQHNNSGLIDGWRGTANADLYSYSDGTYGTYGGAKETATPGAQTNYGMNLMSARQAIQLPPIPPGGVWQPTLDFSWILEKTGTMTVNSAFAYADIYKLDTVGTAGYFPVGSTRTSPAMTTRFDESFDLSTYIDETADFREYFVVLGIAVNVTCSAGATVTGIITKPEFAT